MAKAIYISSAAIRRASLTKAVSELVQAGFHHIELTAGNPLSQFWLEELLEIQAKHNVNFLCHNYFPVPSEPFVLNLASRESQVISSCFQLIQHALDTSEKLQSDLYAIHAGFRLEVPVSELGKPISKQNLVPSTEAWGIFLQNVQKFYSNNGDIALYIENNVLSQANMNTFGENPFFFTDSADYFKLKESLPFIQPLIDVAHLKVSCASLQLDFQQELQKLVPETNYIHVSDNEGTSDSNSPITEKSMQWIEYLKEYQQNETTYTIEVYGSIQEVASSYSFIEQHL